MFSSVIGSGQYRVLTTAVFASGLILWTAAHRLDRERQLLWLTADRRRGPARLAGGAASFGVVAVAIGLLVGPLIPGAKDDEWFDWRNGGDPTRVVVSPFVDIGARLVDQRDIELFKVSTERPSYYRLAGLDTYENGVWLSRGQESVEEDGVLPGLRPTAGTTHTVRQDFQIQNLSQEWLPAAFAPAEILEADARFNWIADTGSLIIDESRGSVDGLEYSIESVIPDYTAAELRAASTDAPESDPSALSGSGGCHPHGRHHGAGTHLWRSHRLRRPDPDPGLLPRIRLLGRSESSIGRPDPAVPRRTGRLLSTVLGHVRPHGPFARNSGAGCRRVHVGSTGHRGTGGRTRSPAATPTPGRRSTSTISVGCRSSPPPTGAPLRPPPMPDTTPTRTTRSNPTTRSQRPPPRPVRPIPTPPTRPGRSSWNPSFPGGRLGHRRMAAVPASTGVG